MTHTTTPKCSKKTCCTIQYGEDTGVCMLDNCSCHTPTQERFNKDNIGQNDPHGGLHNAINHLYQAGYSKEEPDGFAEARAEIWSEVNKLAEIAVQQDRAYLAGEAQRLIDEENNRPFGVAPVSLKKMHAIINGSN